MELTDRYFIALIPPEPVYKEVNDLKNQIWEQYNSKGALQSPPHITLHMPFKIKEKKEQLLINSLKSITKSREPFNVYMNGFGHFNERVIYIHVQNSVELQSLHKSISKTLKVNHQLFNSDYKNHGFYPHMTIAFRDLKKDMFQAAWKQFAERGFEANIEVKSICLLKHDGDTWEEHYRAPFC